MWKKRLDQKGLNPIKISRSKSNQRIKLGQLIEYNSRNTFLQSRAENEAGRLVPDLLFLKKALGAIHNIRMQ